MGKNNNKPLKTFRDETQKGVSASVFQNEYGKSINLQISYKTIDGFEKSSITILQKNIHAVLNTLTQAKDLISKEIIKETKKG